MLSHRIVPYFRLFPFINVLLLKKNTHLPIFLGVACINPPIPPEETKLELFYEPGTVIAFGETVTYQCSEAYFFEVDYHMPNFTLTCLTDGNFSDPLPWKNCLLPSSKYQYKTRCFCQI